MSLWLNNLLSYVEKHEEGFCPECGSANIAVTVAGEPRKTILFRCRDCGSSEVFNNNVYYIPTRVIMKVSKISEVRYENRRYHLHKMRGEFTY